jgi:hypothetical protein
VHSLIRALALCFALPLAIVRAETAERLRVEGTEFVVIAEDGTEVRGADLIGAELDLGALGTVRVAAVERDATARFDEVWLHSLELRVPGSMLFQQFCTPDPGGDRRAVAYAGFFDETRRYVADPTRFSLSCVSGVEAKCLRWGYLPWRRAPNTGASLAPFYEACIHMARADYCGDDRPSTRNGTLIDVYDRVGVQQRSPGMTDLAFEAGWTERGAVCVHHTRIPEQLELAELPAHCERLRARAQGDACTEQSAAAQGALLFDRSRDTAKR